MRLRATAGRCQMQEAFAEFITDIARIDFCCEGSRYWIEFNFGRSSVFGEEFRANRFGCISAGSAVGAAGLAKAATLAGSAMNALKLALFDVKLAVAALAKLLPSWLQIQSFC